MSDSADDLLDKPLGVPTPKPARPWHSPRIRRLAAGGLGASLLLSLTLVLLLGDPQGGEPRASAAIAMRDPEPAPAPAPAPAPPAPAAEKPPSLHSSASEVEHASGVTVTRPAGTGAPGEAVIIRVPTPDGVRLAPAPDPRLTERGRHGAMPKLGAGGLRPLDLYARPDDASGGARIAIVVSGVGIGQAATASAIARLPPAITLGLAPYASDLDKTAARAREAGHELVMQVPMEPFDYPDSDPGPQTLLTSSRPPENLDRLAWAMSRAPGIIGIVNFMGGKLLSDPAALEPIAKEVGARGLAFVDDGSVQGSKLRDLSLKLKAPSARAAVVIDSVMRPEAIDAELARLEEQAKANGFVLASSSAQQMSIDRIARWAREVESRGIRLVPVSIALRGPMAGAPAKVSAASP